MNPRDGVVAVGSGLAGAREVEQALAEIDCRRDVPISDGIDAGLHQGEERLRRLDPILGRLNGSEAGAGHDQRPDHFTLHPDRERLFVAGAGVRGPVREVQQRASGGTQRLRSEPAARSAHCSLQLTR